MKINGIKLVTLSRGVLRTYRENVKGNEDLSKLDIRKKLTRNVLLAKEDENATGLFENLLGVRYYTYGNLHIRTWFNHVLTVENHKGGHHYKGWRKDHKRYDKLNKDLEIEV